jgi:hypothetical protein
VVLARGDRLVISAGNPVPIRQLVQAFGTNQVGGLEPPDDTDRVISGPMALLT